MTGERAPSGRLAVAVAGLVVLHFLLRPLLVAWPISPDLLAGALLLAALRLRAGYAALVGFVLGILEAAVAATGLGALAATYALAGYLAVRSWEVVFTEVRFFLPVYLTVGAWVLLLAGAWFTGTGPGWKFFLLQAPAGGVLTAIVCAPLYRVVEAA